MNILDVKSQTLNEKTKEVKISVSGIDKMTNRQIEWAFDDLLDAIYKDGRVKYRDNVELRIERIENYARIAHTERMTNGSVDIATVTIRQRRNVVLNIETFLHSLSLYQTMCKVSQVGENVDLNNFIMI